MELLSDRNFIDTNSNVMFVRYYVTGNSITIQRMAAYTIYPLEVPPILYKLSMKNLFQMFWISLQKRSRSLLLIISGFGHFRCHFYTWAEKLLVEIIEIKYVTRLGL